VKMRGQLNIREKPVCAPRYSLGRDSDDMATPATATASMYMQMNDGEAYLRLHFVNVYVYL
jgi:hypothetical protein